MKEIRLWVGKTRPLGIALWGAVMLAFAVLGSANLAAAGLQPVNLRCEHRVNPLGIGELRPRLSWQLQSADAGAAARGETQSAYQIQVGSTPGGADLWDSGKVPSAQTADLVYAGQPLTSGKQCFWQVRVYDASNTVSGWSAPAQWSMGLLSPADWQAQWIGYDAAYELTPQQAAANALYNTSGLKWMRYPSAQAQAGGAECCLRKQVVLPEGLTNAVVALYADNQCAVWANGQPASAAAVRWEATARINVTGLMHSGTNVIALAATNSDGLPAGVIGRLVVQFASGSISNFPVDGTWKSTQQPAGGWLQTNFDDTAWLAAEATGVPWQFPALNDIARVPAPYLRKNFAVGQTITRATVYVTALGAYELHLNGQKVSPDVLTPGWSQFTKRVYYQTYDVTGLVQPGANTLGAILGDGWYASVIGFTGRRMFYGGIPRLCAQLVLELADGSTQIVASDASWKACYGPIQFADFAGMQLRCAPGNARVGHHPI